MLRAKRLFLVSNSFCHGQGFLEHCAEAIKAFLGPITTLVFIPYALKDWDQYTQIVREGFGKMGIKVIGVHETEDKSHRDVISHAEAVFVGGGNTFRLLEMMYHHSVLSIIRERVNAGTMPYLGASAGSNVAGPTIRTTNDMPIVYPPSFNALGLVPFQINPHYIDADPSSQHMGETREKRIKEFHEENETTVIGIREGSWIKVEGGRAWLEGTTGAMIFERGLPPSDWGMGVPITTP